MNYDKFSQGIDDEIPLPEVLKSTKPNVMLSGKTGVGKSSLINKIFGQDVAIVGVGKPVTTEIKTHESESVNIIDVQGLEIGQHENYKRDVLKEIMTRSKEGIERSVHIMWHLVAGKRIEPQEIEMLKEFGIPCFVILNQVDLMEEEDIKKMVEEIQKLCQFRVFTTVGNRAKRFPPDSCPECKSSEIVVKRNGTDWVCMDCSTKGVCTGLHPMDQTVELVKSTSEIVPDIVREAFLFAQRIDHKDRYIKSAAVVATSIAAATALAIQPIPLVAAASLGPIEMTMVVLLIQIWGLHKVPRLKRRLFDTFWKPLLITCIGIGILSFIPILGDILEAEVVIVLTIAFAIAIIVVLYYLKTYGSEEENIDKAIGVAHVVSKSYGKIKKPFVVTPEFFEDLQKKVDNCK